jgi:integrase
MAPDDGQERKAQERLWPDAVARWRRLGTWKASTTRKHEARIFSKLPASWQDLAVSEISTDLVQDLVDEQIDAGVGVRSVNRQLEVIRAVLRAAASWSWLERPPTIRLLRRSPRRLRWLSYAEAKRLIEVLPEHLRPVVAFSLETGLRKRNVLELEWSQVDTEHRLAWIHADQAKGRQPIPVPLSPTAAAVVEQQRGQHLRYVFTYRGQPIKESNTKAWRTALERAGIRNFRWHDLRHTWASWHAQSGTPLHVLQELGGWQTASMVKVYAHLSTGHLRQHVLSFHSHIHGLGIVTRMGGDPNGGSGEHSELEPGRGASLETP